MTKGVVMQFSHHFMEVLIVHFKESGHRCPYFLLFISKFSLVLERYFNHIVHLHVCAGITPA